MEQRVVDLGQMRLSVLEAGQGGRPLLLVHGFTGAKEDFADEVDRLAAGGRHVVAPDLRGHGGSGQPAEEDSYSLQIFADDMLSLVDELGWERFELLGHSMGGMVAQLVTFAAPARVERLVLMDTHHGKVGGLDPEILAIGIDLARTQGLRVVRDLLKMGQDPLANPAHRRTCEERPGYEEWSDAKMLACSPAMFAKMLTAFDTTPDRLDDLASVGCPTLVLVGELDEGFLEASRQMAATIPDAELVVIAQGGHSPQFEATSEWRAAVDGFLEAEQEESAA